MRRIAALLILLTLTAALLCACFAKSSYTKDAGEDGVIRAYSFDADTDRYTCEGIEYAYRLTLTGTLPHAVRESTYVVLSNAEDVTFEETARQFFSSDTADFFDPEQTVVVEMR